MGGGSDWIRWERGRGSEFWARRYRLCIMAVYEILIYHTREKVWSLCISLHILNTERPGLNPANAIRISILKTFEKKKIESTSTHTLIPLAITSDPAIMILFAKIVALLNSQDHPSIGCTRRRRTIRMQIDRFQYAEYSCARSV
jgi:hypothetical protein